MITYSNISILQYLRANKELLPLVILSSVFFFFFFKDTRMGQSLFTYKPVLESAPLKKSVTLFEVQCVDTMKVSRDRAREKIDERKITAVKLHVKKIKEMGANCIAIGTPYNEEFIPYMKLWVEEARKHNLRVWFRGNWSEWEGWFSYPKGMTTSRHIQKTTAFILGHPELFKNDDLFTPSPEAENGGPFAPVDTPAKQALFRSFLQSQHNEVQKAFVAIGKKVTTNWLSMSGGVAKGVLTKPAIQSMDNTVTLDHYVKNESGMDEYVTFFHKAYHADIVLGEFGAPIPDINGKMTPKEQAAFVDLLFKRLYYHLPYVKGVNYWTLSESSTALITDKGEDKEVVQILKKYYQPAVFKGKVINTKGEGIPSITLKQDETKRIVITNKKGEFSMTIPANPTKIIIDDTNKYKGKVMHISPKSNEEVTATITLQPQQTPIFYRIKTFLSTLPRQLRTQQ